MLAIPVSDRLLALGFSRFDSNYHPFASRPLGPGEVQEQEVCRSARRVWVWPTPQGLASDVADSLLVSSRSWSPQPRGRSREYLRSQLPSHPDPRKFQHSGGTVSASLPARSNSCHPATREGFSWLIVPQGPPGIRATPLLPYRSARVRAVPLRLVFAPLRVERNQRR